MTERVDLDELQADITWHRDMAKHGTYVASITRLLAMISELRELRAKAQGGGWIRCSERMPPLQELVLIAVTCMGHRDARSGFHLGDHWVDYIGDKLELYEVTDWRELPPPPKEL
jgi:hypothetical protein